MAGRVGNPNKISDDKKEDLIKQNFAELKGKQSRDIAAESVGMNKESYRQAKTIVDSKEPEIIEQWEKKVSSFLSRPHI